MPSYQRIARLDFDRGASATDVQLSNDTQLGILVDCIASLHRDIAAEVVQVCVHAQTQKFDFAKVVGPPHRTERR